VVLQAWPVVLLLAGTALLLHGDGDAAFVGAVMVALALPTVWWVTIGLIRKLSVHGSVGRVFG
jgi:hypothetical protein